MTIEQLEQELADLRLRVEDLEAHSTPGTHSDGEHPLPELEARVLAITRDLFPEPIGVEVMFDPQEPDRKWRVICVPAQAVLNLDQTTTLWRQRMLNELGPENMWRYSLRVEFPE